MAGIIGPKWCNMRVIGICMIVFLVVASSILVSAQEITEQKASNQEIGPNYVARVSKNSSHPATRSGYNHVWPVSSIYLSLLILYWYFVFRFEFLMYFHTVLWQLRKVCLRILSTVQLLYLFFFSLAFLYFPTKQTNRNQLSTVKTC